MAIPKSNSSVTPIDAVERRPRLSCAHGRGCARGAVVAGAVGSCVCVWWSIVPYGTGPGWALITVVTLGWCAAVGLVYGGPPRGGFGRLMLWLAVMCGAYGRILGSNLYSITSIETRTGTLAQWQQEVVFVGEQTSAIVAMAGMWVLLTGALRDPVGVRLSQHERLWPVGLGIVLLWFFFQAIAFSVSRAVLPASHLLPTGVGPFHQGIGWAEWLRAILAGPYEELGFTGLTALLVLLPLSGGPPTKLRMATVVAISTALRAIPHLYYGRGELTSSTVLPIPDHLASALNQWVWCLVWAGGAMWMFARYRRIWPIVAAHSLWNLTAKLVFLPVIAALFAGYFLARWLLPNHRWTRSIQAAGRDLKRHTSQAAGRLRNAMRRGTK